MPAPTLWLLIFGIIANGKTESHLIKGPIESELTDLICKLTDVEVNVDLESVMLQSLPDSGVNIDQTANALLSITLNEGKSTSDVLFDFRPVHFGPNAAFYTAPEVSKPSVQQELRSLMTELFAGHQKPSVRFDTLGHLIHADFSLARLERLFQLCSLKSKFGNGQDAISCWRNAQNVALESQRMNPRKKHTEDGAPDSAVDLVDASESTQHYQYLYLKQPYLCAKERDNRVNFVFAPKEDFSYFLTSMAELYADYGEADDDSSDWLRRHTNPSLIWLVTVEQCLDTKANVLDPVYVMLLNRYFAARSSKLAEELSGLFITSLSSVLKSPDMRVASTVADAVKMLRVILEIPETEEDGDDATFLSENALEILRVPQLQMLWLALEAGYERVTRTRLLMTLNDLYICLILDAAQSRLYDSGTIVADGALWCSLSPAQMIIDAQDARLASIDSVDLTIADAAKRIYTAVGDES